MCLFFCPIQGQDITDSLKIDTVKLYHNTIIIKYPENFYKSEQSEEYGGIFIYYASRPPISHVIIMEATNSKMDFGEDCIMTDKTELEHRYTEKGVCPLRGYYRSDTYKGTRIKISYESVSECEYLLFDYILDSVQLINNVVK